MYFPGVVDCLFGAGDFKSICGFMIFLFFGLAYLVAMLAVFYDLFGKRIPNWLTLGVLIIVLPLSAFLGVSLFFSHLLGAVVAGGVWWILWRNGWMGGGDQKLMMTLGFFVGDSLVFEFVFLVAIFGGLQALVSLGFKKITGSQFFCWRGVAMPYSVAIFLGLIFTAVIPISAGGWLF